MARLSSHNHPCRQVHSNDAHICGERERYLRKASYNLKAYVVPTHGTSLGLSVAYLGRHLISQYAVLKLSRRYDVAVCTADKGFGMLVRPQVRQRAILPGPKSWCWLRDKSVLFRCTVCCGSACGRRVTTPCSMLTVPKWSSEHTRCPYCIFVWNAM